MLPGMSAGQRRSAARSCGQVIARLHSVPVDGFYRRHADGSFEFADNAALQAADLANRLDNLRLLAGAGLLTQAEVRRAEGLLPEAVAARGDGPAVLCHGELFPDHIFVAAGEDEAVTVTGLIDFGDACGGRPLDDLALLCWEWPEVDRAALAAGDGAAPFWTDQGRRLALSQLRMLIGYAAHDLRAGQPGRCPGLPGRAQGRARLPGLVKLCTMRFRGNASADAADEKRPGEGERCQRRPTGGGDGDEQGAFVGHGSERTGSSAAAATGFSATVTAALARAPLVLRTSSSDARPAVTAMAAITTVACWKAASAAAPPDGWPRTVTRTATPKTMPSWRAIVTTPDPVANRAAAPPRRLR